MIILTRLNGPRFAVNPDLLERVDSTPDTVLTLLDGTKYVVAEPMEDVIDAIRTFRASVIAAARDWDHSAHGPHPTPAPRDDDAVAPAVPLRRTRLS